MANLESSNNHEGRANFLSIGLQGVSALKAAADFATQDAILIASVDI